MVRESLEQLHNAGLLLKEYIFAGSFGSALGVRTISLNMRIIYKSRVVCLGSGANQPNEPSRLVDG